MGLDLWFREDVARILASAQEGMRASTCAVSASDSEMATIYRQGFVDALRTVGLAFGVAVPGAPREIRGEWRPRVIEGEWSAPGWREIEG